MDMLVAGAGFDLCITCCLTLAIVPAQFAALVYAARSARVGRIRVSAGMPSFSCRRRIIAGYFDFPRYVGLLAVCRTSTRIRSAHASAHIASIDLNETVPRS